VETIKTKSNRRTFGLGCNKSTPSSQISLLNNTPIGSYFSSYWDYTNANYPPLIANKEGEKVITGEKNGYKFQIHYQADKFRYWTIDITSSQLPDGKKVRSNKNSLDSKVFFMKKMNEKAPVMIIQWKDINRGDGAIRDDWFWLDALGFQSLSESIHSGKKAGVFEFLDKVAEITGQPIVQGVVKSIHSVVVKYTSSSEKKLHETYLGRTKNGDECKVEISVNKNRQLEQANFVQTHVGALSGLPCNKSIVGLCSNKASIESFSFVTFGVFAPLISGAKTKKIECSELILTKIVESEN
jgi:hypothetical protein